MKNSIKKRVNLIVVFMVVCSIIIFVSIMFCFKGYKKTLRFYTDSMHDVYRLCNDVNAYNYQMDEFVNLGGEYYWGIAQTGLSTMKSDASDLFGKRFTYSDNIKGEIETIYTVNMVAITSEMASINDNVSDQRTVRIHKEMIDGILVELENRMDVMLNNLDKEARAKQDSLDNAAVVFSILTIISVVGMGTLAVILIIFIKGKVAKPLYDIYDWTLLFKDGYCGMNDLDESRDDEIGRLAKSFNIVKEKLSVANKLKEEYDKAAEKLKSEEEHKKKFVQQLYDEKRDKEAISNVAKHDGLTGLYNRRTFDSVVDDFIEKRSAGAEGALFLIDMDNFKTVNDTLGHLSGDEALKTLAGAMRVVFTGAYLGRYGGDEFIAFVTGYKGDDKLHELGTSLCNKMDMIFEKDGKSVRLSVSIGIATTVGMEDYSQLYMMADRALYYSKENGRNQYKLASDLEDEE